MTTSLITGANKGIGFETARQLIAAGHTVWLGSRDPERGRAAAEKLGARALVIDVTDDASVAAAVRTVEEAGTGLDVLVNNAGIEPRGEDGGPLPALDAGADRLRTVFETNVLGPLRVTQAFLPLLRRSDSAAVLNLSSGLGSLAGGGGSPYGYPSVEYPVSKAALNMLTIKLAAALPGIRVTAVDPGFTKTDLNHHAGTQTVEEGAAASVREALAGNEGETGTFVSAAGPLPW
ncbi:SDR family NAD(P)-dependent oxidoreductase [Streptomyces sp. NPDC088923]|uniref:SDR family NAD(P)-dependent oxidoreductase n=1 Tax=Streptomyces sp. NPDC088923 TaxID=3365913 RepID=UPI00380F3E49